ncbi:MAG TPA: hypothetical protein VGS79_29425 [Puia sp.]|nr:hypothetical protein [Puia sp.]
MRNNRLLLVVFAVYAVLSAWSMLHHVPWSDEVHSWNIAKSSGSFGDLLAHSRYEGHPPGWYTLLWIISRFTHQVGWMQAVQWVIACTVIYLVLFCSPFPVILKVLIPFGYYFLFEYAVFSRNYGIGVLLVCLLCLIIRRRFPFQRVLYLVLLYLLFNIHLIAMILACSLHVYHLLLQRERRQKNLYLLFDVLIGLVFVVLALRSIYPPPDSALKVDFQDSAHVLAIKPFINTPLRAFVPLPAWWDYHFWNTQFLLDEEGMHGVIRYFQPLLSLALIASIFWLLWPNRKCVALFGANLLISCVVSITSFTLGSARHAGFLFIAFFAAVWLFCYETSLTAGKTRLIIVLLSFQVVAGVFVFVETLRFPFSNLDQIKTLTGEVPPGRQLVTDYWTMNAYAAFMNKPIYCVDLQKEKSFVVWNSEMVALLKNPYRYSSGLAALFAREGTDAVYMVSMHNPQMLTGIDPNLFSAYHVELFDEREGAIEKGSNLYLYKISATYAGN